MMNGYRAAAGLFDALFIVSVSFALLCILCGEAVMAIVT